MENETIHIILKGECPIKKNAMKKLWFRIDAKGNKIPLKFPLMYYPDPYKNWVKDNIGRLATYKSKHPEIGFNSQYNPGSVVIFQIWKKTTLSTK